MKVLYTNRFAGILVLIGSVLLPYQSSADDEYDSLVKDIIELPQMYSGEVVDNLVDLGPEAVPAIGAALSQGVKFPATLVHALGLIGSEQGMEPLLEFLQTRTPFYQRDQLTITTILALKGVDNRLACEPLTIILDDITVDPSIRLAAARTISSLCLSENAQNFVLNAYRNMRVRSIGETPRFLQDEVLLGLIDVNNDASETILINLLRFGGEVRIYVPVILHLSTRGGEAVVECLLRVIGEKKLHEYPIRVAAVRALLNMNEKSRPSLATSAMELVKEAESGRWPQQILEEVKQLNVRAASY